MEDEELEEILGRLDIPLEAYEDQETLRAYLESTLELRTPKQVEALETITTRIWENAPHEFNMEDLGIRRITIEYPWGKELRYGIQGLPGLWGWTRVREIMAAGE